MTKTVTASTVEGAMLVRVVIELEKPEDASFEDIASYVEDAVATWCGSLRPPRGYGPHDDGDPMFELDRDTVKVIRVTKRRKK